MAQADERLLERFAAGGDEAALAGLIESYGPMIYGRALRRLGDHADAEDAAQAVFIILARKARRLRRGTVLSGWLWRTTGYVCRNIEKSRRRRRAHERAAGEMPRPAAEDEPGAGWEEVSPELDAAIDGLPRKSRDAVVACYLAGKSHDEAARELGVSPDAVRKRCEYGVTKLRSGLARRGVAVGAGALAAMLAGGSASAAVPAALSASIKAAALGAAGAGGATATAGASFSIAEGAMKMMLVAKMKVAAVVMVVTVAAGTGTGIVAAKAMEGAGPGGAPNEALAGPQSPAKPVAGARYVSPDGKASWNEAVKRGAPCSPETAFKSARAGDTVYFLGGNYEVGQSEGYRPVWGPDRSGTRDKPIVFAACPGEKPVIVGRPEVRGGGRKRNYRLVTFGLGNNHQSHIVFDGFHFVAKGRTGFCGIRITRGCDHKDKPEAWAKGCVVRNCTFDGGKFVIGSHPDDNPNSADNNEAVRIEETDGTLIRNCRIWNYRHVKDNHNVSAVKTYHNRNMVIENCEIYDSSVGIFAKSNSDDSVFRNNFIHDCKTAFDFTAFGWKSKSPNRADGYWTSDSSRCRIVNNVVAGCRSAVSVFAQDSANVDDLQISNNSFHGGGIGLSDTARLKCFNNIVSGYSRLGLNYNRQKIKVPMAEVDHNQWGPNRGAIVNVWVKGRPSALRYTLAKWQASGELADRKNPGGNSLASDPKFVNASKTMKKLDDFRLAADSPCRRAGRAGADMGADIDAVGPRGDAAKGDRFTELARPRGLKFISFDTPRAYPGLAYYTRMAVIGGKWPYTFELVESPAGARITRERGEVLWTAPGAGGAAKFKVKATDSAGKSVSKTWTVAVSARDFRFVSPTGDNAAGDGSIAKPWKTVQHALNSTGGIGTIYLRGGVYKERSRKKGSPGGYDEFTLMTGTGGYDFGPQKKPTADNPLHIASYPGEKAIIEPAEDGLRSVALWKHYILFENIEVRGVAQNVLWLGNHAVVRGVEVHKVRGKKSNCQAVWVGAGHASEITVQDCHLHDIRQPAQPTHASGMTLYGVEDGLFEDNHVHDTDSGGINDKDGGRGNTYRGNYVHDVGRLGIMFMGQNHHWDCVAHDNVIGRMPKTFPAFRVGLHNNPVYRIRVHHNTALGPFSSVRAEETVAWNNIILASQKIAVSAGDNTPGFMMRRCAVWSPAPKAFKWGSFWKTPDLTMKDFLAKAPGAKDILYAKVELADTAKGDYRIKGNAAALARLAGEGDYMGAHEQVLEWIASGAKQRNAGNVAERLAEEAKPEAEGKAAPDARPAAAAKGDARAAKLYRDARAAERAGMKAIARTLYERLAKEHPGSALAEKARAKL